MTSIFCQRESLVHLVFSWNLFHNEIWSEKSPLSECLRQYVCQRNFFRPPRLSRMTVGTWDTALWKRPLVRGLSMRYCTEAPPALSPKTVTLPGSPPKAAIFLCTQRRASTWSFSPLLPGHASFWRLKNPENNNENAVIITLLAVTMLQQHNNLQCRYHSSPNK